jgi:hypothetical protein
MYFDDKNTLDTFYTHKYSDRDDPLRRSCVDLQPMPRLPCAQNEPPRLPCLYGIQRVFFIGHQEAAQYCVGCVP